MTNPSSLQYQRLHDAFDHFNHRLFAGTLPPVIFVFARKRNTYGTFFPERWVSREADPDSSSPESLGIPVTAAAKFDEITLNPDTFADRSERDILSTLVHEMCHLKQQHFGDDIPQRKYHNAEWVGYMKDAGLYPSSTGEPGGAELGNCMSHYVIDGGAFDLACADFLLTGPAIQWQSFADAAGIKRPKDKFKYTCASCGQRAWAKRAAKLACGDCKLDMAMEDV